MSKILWLLFQLLLILLCCPTVFGDSYPLWGDLQAGPHPVGFTARFEYDNSRVFRAKYNADGKLYAGNRARPIQIAIWYPAEKTTQNHMRFEEYAYLLAQELDFSPLTPEKKQEAGRNFFRLRGVTAAFSDQTMKTFLEEKAFPARDATQAKGKFPLIIYAPGSSGAAIENTVLCEYLASHGYIVAALPSMGAYERSASVDLTGFYAYMQDIEFVIGFMHRFPNVDPNALGIAGFSMGGSAATLVQMRNFDVDAVVYLDTGIVYDVVEDWFRPSNYYNKADLRAAQLYFVRKDVDGLNLKRLDAAPFAETYVMLSEKGYRHVDFISYGLLAGVINPKAADKTKDARRLYQLVCESANDFFDAYVKHDSSKRKALDTALSESAESSVFTASYRAAAGAPPREFELMQIIRDGNLAEAKSLMQKYSDHSLFREATLNNLGYEFLFRGDTKKAIAILDLNAQTFPQSANAQDSLSEAYEAAGDADKSLAHAKRAIELLNADTVMEASRKQQIQQALEQRMKKLKNM